MILGIACLLLAMLMAGTYLARSIGMRFSLSFLLFASLLLIHGIGLLVYLLWTSRESFIFDRAMSAVDAETVTARLLLAVSLMLVCVMVGSQLGVLLVRTLRLNARPAAAVVYRPGPAGLLALLLLALVMAAISVADGQLAAIREYLSIDLSGTDRAALRLESGGTPYYLYNLFLAAVAPFLVFVAYANWRSRGRPMGAGLVLAALFLATLLGKFGTLSKAPPVVFLLQMVLLRALLMRGDLNIPRILRVAVIAVLLFSGIVAITFPELGLDGVLKFLYYRMFDIPNEGLVEYFTAFPAFLPHGWGAGILPGLLGGADSGWIPNYLAVAALSRDSYASTSNALFIADAWAEFSWAGVVLFSLVVGLVVRFVDLFAQRYGRNDEWACVTAACAFGIFTLLSTSMTTALLTGGLAIVPLLSWLIASRPQRSIVGTSGSGG